MGRQLAVLVNRNAHGVTDEHLAALRRIAGAGLHVTDSSISRAARCARSSTAAPGRWGSAVATAPGEVLYDGPFTIAAAGTIHSYAHGMSFFPFAEALDDAFHLRVSALTGVETLVALPRAFDGGYRHPRLLDFAARAIAIELDAPARFHIAGDLHGPATRFTVRLSRCFAPMLFRAPPGAPGAAAPPGGDRRRGAAPR